MKICLPTTHPASATGPKPPGLGAPLESPLVMKNEKLARKTRYM